MLQGSEGCLYRVVIDRPMICCDVQGRPVRPDLKEVATSDKKHLFNLAQLCRYNGMMASAISMMKWTNK